jgi:hypothetical protein
MSAAVDGACWPLSRSSRRSRAVSRCSRVGVGVHRVDDGRTQQPGIQPGALAHRRDLAWPGRRRRLGEHPGGIVGRTHPVFGPAQLPPAQRLGDQLATHRLGRGQRVGQRAQAALLD